MNTCKDCIHWDTLSVAARDQVSFDGYEPKRYCLLLCMGSELEAACGLEAAAQGIGGADITTGPDFGCIHFEQRERQLTELEKLKIHDDVVKKMHNA